MGYGSAGTPAWVDEEAHDQEKTQSELKALRKENEDLKKRIRQLEDDIKRLKK